MNPNLSLRLFYIFLAASVCDPRIVISVSNFIRNSNLTDEEKNSLLEFYSLILSEYDVNN